MEYKPLETEFMKSGFRFRQMKREGDIALFHKVAIKGALHPASFDCGFEVVVITNRDAYELAGTVIEAAEAYPSPEMWGTKGWTYSNLYSAECKFDILTGKVSAPVQEEVTEETEVPSVKKVGGPGRPKVERPALSFPVGEFSVKDLAEFNKVEYPTAFLFLKEQEEGKLVKRTRTERRAAKGKETQLFEKIS